MAQRGWGQEKGKEEEKRNPRFPKIPWSPFQYAVEVLNIPKYFLLWLNCKTTSIMALSNLSLTYQFFPMFSIAIRIKMWFLAFIFAFQRIPSRLFKTKIILAEKGNNASGLIFCQTSVLILVWVTVMFLRCYLVDWPCGDCCTVILHLSVLIIYNSFSHTRPSSSNYSNIMKGVNIEINK
jgi:hypothetical protein